jgi:hypothetical protein
VWVGLAVPPGLSGNSCCGRRLWLWLLATLFLVAWFLLSAWVLFAPSVLGEEALREVVEKLAGFSAEEGLLARAALIFRNNVVILLAAAVPALGVFIAMYALYVTAVAGRLIAELLASTLGGGWESYFLHYIVLTPFFPLEMLAYGIAVAEGAMFLRHRSLRRYISGVLAAIVVLAVSAMVEAAVMAGLRAGL